MKMRQSLQQGFTLIEMLVIAPIVVLAIGAFLTVIISMTGEVLSSRGANALAYDVQDAMNRIEADIKLSTTFLETNNVPLTAGGAQGYNNDNTSNFTNVGGTSGTSLILNQLVTTGNPLSTSSGIVYLPNKPNDCASAQVQNNTPMTMNVVYFVKNDPANNNLPTLWRRTIMPSTYADPAQRCAEPWQQPSCLPYYMANNTASFCKTNDIKLVAGVSAANFVVQYFTSASSTTANANASDTGVTAETRAAALVSSPTASISITAAQSVAGRTVERSATLRATRLDTNASTIGATPVQSAIAAGPTDVVATGASASQINVSWYPPAGVATSYTLQYSRKSDFSSPTTINNITSTSTSITGLSQATVYFFRVSATNSFGTSPNSTTAMGTSTGVNVWSAYTRIIGVGDWNLDGKNDLVGYKSNGDVELHLGKGDNTFGGIISLANIGTSLKSIVGPGTLPSGAAPILWWTNTDGSAYLLKSDAGTGTAGGAITSATAGTFSACTGVFAAPLLYTANSNVVVVCQTTTVSNYALSSTGAASFLVTNGGGWNGYNTLGVFGGGDYNIDAKGEIMAVDSGGTLIVYNGNGAGWLTTNFTLGTGWGTPSRVTGGWDFNGDNKTDILLYLTASNLFCMYNGNGATGLAAGAACSIPIN